MSGIKDFASFKSNTAHIVGQPFTLEAIGVPCNAKLHCNCGGAEADVLIQMSVAASCPSCQKVYNCLFNPTKNAVEFSIAMPEPEKVPS
jgi:hypothetical protein